MEKMITSYFKPSTLTHNAIHYYKRVEKENDILKGRLAIVD